MVVPKVRMVAMKPLLEFGRICWEVRQLIADFCQMVSGFAVVILKPMSLKYCFAYPAAILWCLIMVNAGGYKRAEISRAMCQYAGPVRSVNPLAVMAAFRN